MFNSLPSLTTDPKSRYWQKYIQRNTTFKKYVAHHQVRSKLCLFGREKLTSEHNQFNLSVGFYTVQSVSCKWTKTQQLMGSSWWNIPLCYFCHSYHCVGNIPHSHSKTFSLGTVMICKWAVSYLHFSVCGQERPCLVILMWDNAHNHFLNKPRENVMIMTS